MEANSFHEIVSEQYIITIVQSLSPGIFKKLLGSCFLFFKKFFKRLDFLGGKCCCHRN